MSAGLTYGCASDISIALINASTFSGVSKITLNTAIFHRLYIIYKLDYAITIFLCYNIAKFSTHIHYTKET